MERPARRMARLPIGQDRTRRPRWGNAVMEKRKCRCCLREFIPTCGHHAYCSAECRDKRRAEARPIFVRLRNRSGLRHGLHSGQLAPDMKYIEIRLNALRRSLEDGVMEAHGAVGRTHAALIRRAIDWEAHRLKCQRWLKLKADELGPMELLKFSEQMARASTEMSKAVEALKLERDRGNDLLDRLYARPLPRLPLSDNGNGEE